ncbi:phage late control D family protein [Myxococcus sp. Y35]|uniref:phage late control D family protein n=1 Tax=Pseudomyxococcus flavus TaxID=3115648 RepID=UPI003CFB819A
MPDATTQTEHHRPTVRIFGRADARVTGLVSSMRLDETEGGLCSLELRFEALARYADAEAELVFEDEQLVRLGAPIGIYTGPESAPQEIFRGVITGIEAVFVHDSAPEFVVLAEDALQKARLARRTQVHDAVTLAELAENLARDLGLTPVITGLREPLGLQVQWNESDLAFIRRLLASRDADLQVTGDELHVSPRSEVRRGTLELNLYSELRRVRVTADLAHQATEVTCAGWNAIQGAAVSGRSAGSRPGPGAGRTGAELLQQTLGPRREHLGSLPVSTSEEATAIARAAFDARARRFVCIDATAEGTPALRVGTHVRLSGLSARFDNTYYVVRASHRYDTLHGYETDFEAECAFLGEP